MALWCKVSKGVIRNNRVAAWGLRLQVALSVVKVRRMKQARTFKTLAVQGEAGAYAHGAAMQVSSKAKVHFYPTFASAVRAAERGEVEAAVIPIDNSTMGRIADIHQLLPGSTLHIVAELHVPIHHHLLAVKGAKLGDIREVYSQLPALTQCANTLKKMKLKPVEAYDTAGAAKQVAAWGDATKAALASSLAGELYGLTSLKAPMNDEPHNTTRFVVLAREVYQPGLNVPCKTSLLFRTRDIPAALYKALGGFATNGINLTKIESYVVGGKFHHAQFYVEAEGHVDAPAFKQALEELNFYAAFVRVLGCYPRG